MLFFIKTASIGPIPGTQAISKYRRPAGGGINRDSYAPGNVLRELGAQPDRAAGIQMATVTGLIR